MVDEVSFDPLGSSDEEDTDAVASSCPSCVGRTTTVTLTVFPFGSGPIGQLTVDVPLQRDGVTETNVAPAGTGILTTTPVPSSGPAFAARIVYVRAWFTTTGSGPSVSATETSADGGGGAETVVVARAVRSPVVGSGDVDDTFAVSTIVEPLAAVTFTVTVALALLPDFTDG